MNRIEYEKYVVGLMIKLYCQKKEGYKGLCPDCKELLQYAEERLSRCTYGNKKPTCKKWTIHCYRNVMKERMRTVMRFSGPRMMIYHPQKALIHLFREMIN